MKLTDLFHKQASAPLPYDRERLEPAVRCSICNGEQIAGFRDKLTGRFREVTLIKTDADLRAFMDKYGITENPVKFY